MPARKKQPAEDGSPVTTGRTKKKAAAPVKKRPRRRAQRGRTAPQARSGHRRIAGQGQDDQQIPRLQFQGAGQLRPCPRPAAAPPQGRAGGRRGHRRRLGADLRRRGQGRGQRWQGPQQPAHGQGHPGRAEARSGQGQPRLPGDRPRPRGRGHRLAHRGRAGPGRGADLPHHLQRDHAHGGAERAVARRQDRHGPRPRPGGAANPRPRRRLSAERPARQEGGARLQRRPGAVGGAAAGGGPRARDRGVQARGILEDHRPAGSGRTPGSMARQPLAIVPAKTKGVAAEATARRKRRRRRCRRERSWRSWPSGPARSSRRPTRRRPRAWPAPWTAPPTPSRRSSRRTAPSRRSRRSRPAHCSSRPTSACTSPATAPCGRRRSCTKASIWAAKARWPSSPTCVPTARGSPTKRCRRCAATSAPATARRTCRTKPNRYASGKSAQEAHEAIRPTDLAYTPERVERLLGHDAPHRQDLIRLYTLIYNRFVASQMTPAVFAVTNVEVTAIPQPAPSASEGVAHRPVQGPGQDPEVRRLPQGAGADRQAGGRHAASAGGEAAAGPARPDGQPALHAAAAALQRGVADQGAGKGGHRPAQHLCVDHPQDHVGGAPLHRGAATAASTPRRSARR